MVFSKNPVKILRGLETLYPLKGVEKPEFYLREDVNMIKTAKGITHAFSARTYIKNVCDKIEKMFKTTLKNYGSPLEEGYHPELDKSSLLVGDEINKFRMLVGSANWCVTLRRFDIHYAVSTLGRYSAAPKEGHMKVMLRILGTSSIT